MNPLARHASVHSKQRSRSIPRISKCAQSKRCIALLLTTIAFGPVSAPAFAQTSAPLSPAERARIQQEHEEREAEIRRLLEEQRAKSASVPRKPELAAPPSGGEGETFLIRSIVLVGDEAPPRVIRDILAQHEGLPMGATQMLAVVRDLTNAYVSLGYTTTTVSLGVQNVSEGVLTLEVRWGKVAGWRVNGRVIGRTALPPEDSASPEAEAQAPGDAQRMQIVPTSWKDAAIFAVLPDAVGKPLNMHDVDQAVESLNNGLQAARVQIVPSRASGFSWLDITLVESPRLGVSASLDDSGTAPPEDGKYRVGLDANFGSVMGAELWSAGIGRRIYRGDEREENASLSVSIPLGYWSAEVRHAYNRYNRPIVGEFGRYESDGWSHDSSFKLARVLHRDATRKLTAYARLGHKNSANFIGDTRLEVNSKTYTDLSLGASYLDTLGGGAFYADGSFGRGTRWFDTDSADAPNERGQYPALFRKAAGNLSWQRAFDAPTPDGMPDGTPPSRLDYSVRFGWQYSPQELLASNKFSIGDEYTVRGFKGNSSMGDSGVFLASTLQFPSLFGWPAQPFVGLDFGAVQDRPYDDLSPSSQRLAGAAFGVRTSWPTASLAFTVARPLRVMRPEDMRPVTYFSLNVRL